MHMVPKILWYRTSARICNAIMIDTNLGFMLCGCSSFMYVTEGNVYGNFYTNQQDSNVEYIILRCCIYYSSITLCTSLILTHWNIKIEGQIYLNLFYSGLTQNGVTDISHSSFTSTKFTGSLDIVKLCCLRMVNFIVSSPVLLSHFLGICG